MITRIEIDGFKSFRNFAVDLKPFQVLIGRNGVGKSNLFDAIVLLSDLVGNQTVYESFQKCRGEIWELFTLLPSGERAREMRFVVEMLIDKNVGDELGQFGMVSSTRLRYELTIERRNEGGFERLYVNHESLTAITEENDKWFRSNIDVRHRKQWIQRGRRSPYISTELTQTSEDSKEGKIVVFKHQEGHQGGKSETPVGKLQRTVLSTITSLEYPTAYAARREMLSWQFLQFEPSKLRTPSNIYENTILKPDASNLAAVLWRMSQENKQSLNDISIDMANIVPGILSIDVNVLKEREEILIEATTQDKIKFSSRVLSDGTLRLLALVALRNDTQQRGTICFEEPENGVNPAGLEKAVSLLNDMATNLNPDGDILYDDVLRQVLINTHSPNLLALVHLDNLLVIYMIGSNPRQTYAARLSSRLFADEDRQITFFTIQQVGEYLNSDALTRAGNSLETIRQNLIGS
ncbi:MAG: AAA family ATPase [Chloroflexota bacterium]|nr:AAA family ATPase [Chloroflexota bacterium]